MRVARCHSNWFSPQRAPIQLMREMLTCFLTQVASRVALPLVQSAPPWHPNHQGKLIKWRPKPCLDVAEGGCVVFAAGLQRIVARQSAKSTV